MNIRIEIEREINKWFKEITTPGSGSCCISESPDLGNREDIQAVDIWLFKKSLNLLRERLVELYKSYIRDLVSEEESIEEVVRREMKLIELGMQEKSSIDWEKMKETIKVRNAFRREMLAKLEE